MALEPLYRPREAAPLLRKTTKAVQQLCAGALIRCEVERSPGGRTQYFIPESAIAEYRQRRTQGRAA
jgi:hypothetical protein